VVSAAAGAVGSLVGQIGKILGMRVVGIAGGPEKCKWIVEELGFDAAIDYKNEKVGKRLRELCPDGIDVDFENVGGEIMDDCLARLALRGRVVLCGMISQYNATVVPEGPRNLVNVLMQRGRIEGFIVLDYLGRAGEAFGKLGEWVATGKLTFATDVVVGLENAPTALDRLFIGANRGKLMVKVADNG
jgi:NADPH-dependent curcumin reductase CurA